MSSSRNNPPTRSSLHPMRSARTLAVFASLAALGVAAGASARSLAKSPLQQSAMPHFDEFHGGGSFGIASEPLSIQDAPVGEGQPPSVKAQPVLAGSSIAALPGGDLLVADDDSGKLVRVAAGGDKPVAELEIGAGVSQVVVHPDGSRAYVADRRHDEIVVVDLAKGLQRVDAFRTKAEPFGISLTPDGNEILVTSVADHALTSLDLQTGAEDWSIEIGPEPRGVAVSPSGHEALVGFLTTGSVARVALQGKRPKVSYVNLEPGQRAAAFNRFGGSGQAGAIDPALSDEGKSFVRNTFAVGYIGHGLAVVPHQLSTPHLATDEFQGESSGYGGGNGFTPPVSHRLAFLDTPERGEQGSVRVAMAGTSVHQPRALAYDAGSDTLYLAGYGDDQILAVAQASQASVHAAWMHHVGGGETCGPTGLAVVADTGDLAVWCSLSRKVAWVSGGRTEGAAAQTTHRTEALTASTLSVAAQRGRELFRSGNNPMISTFGAMACSSCHAEVRADGLSWRLQGKNLQTPFLAGRIEGAHPFKWDGKDPDITSSLTNTVTRLGGSGITKEQADDIAAFLDSVEPPRRPSVDSHSAVARGKALFESDATGCLSCHSGPLLTNQQSYDLSEDLDETDTPSLVGLAHSAPYYHDGSAATLEALLLGNANVHGMGRIAKLSDGEIDDLVQYLKTL